MSTNESTCGVCGASSCSCAEASRRVSALATRSTATEVTTVSERTANSVDTHVRVKCSKCHHEGDVWIDPTPFFVEKINAMVLDGLEVANEHIGAAREALLRVLDFETVSERGLSVKDAARNALDVIGWRQPT